MRPSPPTPLKHIIDRFLFSGKSATEVGTSLGHPDNGSIVLPSRPVSSPPWHSPESVYNPVRRSLATAHTVQGCEATEGSPRSEAEGASCHS
jgi:hypothetical protein